MMPGWQTCRIKREPCLTRQRSTERLAAGKNRGAFSAETHGFTQLFDFNPRAAAFLATKPAAMSTLAVGSTACEAAMPPIALATFPRTLAAAPMANGGRAGLTARRASWVAAQTVGDALSRWYNLMFTARGHGLRGGTYTITGGYLSHSPLSIRFDRTRLVSGCDRERQLHPIEQRSERGLAEGPLQRPRFLK